MNRKSEALMPLLLANPVPPWLKSFHCKGLNSNGLIGNGSPAVLKWAIAHNDAKKAYQ